MKKVLVTGGSGFIGCNLVEFLNQLDYEVLNLDKLPPRNPSLSEHWIKCNILEYNKFALLIKEFNPNYVIHLAARTDLRGKTVKDYSANTVGTKNLINALNDLTNLKKVLFASSRLVCKIGHTPNSEDEYSATTPYGKSKVESELIIRNLCNQSNFDWLIFRPTSIWGPWFDEPYRDFFDALVRGRYVHPYKYNISKSFGYVGNSVFLLEKMLDTNKELKKKTIYLADFDNLNVLKWANIIRSKLGKKNVIEVPIFLLKVVASLGTFLEKIGIPRMPLTRFRLNNLVTNMHFDTKPLKEFSDNLPFTIDKGVEETLNWYEKHIR